MVKQITKLTSSGGARACFHLDQHLNEYRQANKKGLFGDRSEHVKQLLLKLALLIKNYQLSKSLFLGSLHIMHCGPSFDLCFLALLSVNERLLSALSALTFYIEEQMFSQRVQTFFLPAPGHESHW